MSSDKSLEWETHWWGTTIKAINWQGKNLLKKIVEELEEEPTSCYDEGDLNIIRDDDNKIEQIEFIR